MIVAADTENERNVFSALATLNIWKWYGKRIAIRVVMCCACSSHWLWTEMNRAAKAALFIASYEGNRRFHPPFPPPVFKLSFAAAHRIT
jgi:hypothetical protein